MALAGAVQGRLENWLQHAVVSALTYLCKAKRVLERERDIYSVCGHLGVLEGGGATELGVEG